MSEPWYRLSIDVDRSGHPIGLSYELHHADTVRAIHVLSPPGPFDSIAEAANELMRELTERYGVQLRLV